MISFAFPLSGAKHRAPTSISRDLLFIAQVRPKTKIKSGQEWIRSCHADDICYNGIKFTDKIVDFDSGAAAPLLANHFATGVKPAVFPC